MSLADADNNEPVTSVYDDTDITAVIRTPAAVRVSVGSSIAPTRARVYVQPNVTSVVEDVGPPGVPGDSAPLTYVAAEAIFAYTAVRVGPDNLAYRAEPEDDPYGVVGVAEIAAREGEGVTVTDHGELQVAGTLPVGPLFIGPGGALVPTPPVTGWQLQMGVALTPHLLFVRPQILILL